MYINHRCLITRFDFNTLSLEHVSSSFDAIIGPYETENESGVEQKS